jgi:predicted DNA-binding transcriptional regulator AlpA
LNKKSAAPIKKKTDAPEPTTAPTPVDPTMRLLSRQEVLNLIPVSYPCLWLWVRDGIFPAPRALGPVGATKNRVAWLESDVRAWIAAQPQRRPRGSKREYVTPIAAAR